MGAQILDGKAISAEIREEVRKEVGKLKAEKGLTPGLAVVLVGEDPASKIYVNNKAKTSRELGFHSELHLLDAATPHAALMELIGRLARDPGIHGILVQSPMPGQIDEGAVLLAVPPEKDVDGFHPINAGRLANGQSALVPCTPLGCLEMLKRTGLDPKGLHAVVVGRSHLVGKPVAQLLLSLHCTVTICHSRTKDLGSITRQGDVLVAAVGKPRMITADMVKPGAVVIDVGINRGADGKLVGDVDFAPVAEKASWITPVPGGVGPMTIAMLMKNTLQAAKASLG